MDKRMMTLPEQMADAQAGCVPCKLCGGHAVITDAGAGMGYYITCENGSAFRVASGCLINERRLGGWAYNVMDWWNRLHRVPETSDTKVLVDALTEARAALHQHYIDWDGEPEDAVPLQLARTKCDEALALHRGN